MTLSGAAVVTGASGGIGLAVARALAARGVALLVTGRDAARLEGCARELGRGARVVTERADLATDEGIRAVADRARRELGRVDVLVHAAGLLRLGDVRSAPWDDLDELLRVNVRAPFLLTKALLPLLEPARGQIVFVNSTAALAPGADNRLYAASKAALRILADGVRDQVNPLGVRVLSIFLGRTATAMQEAAHRAERRPYAPSELVQPEDVAESIVGALTVARSAEVTEMVIRPMRKPPGGR